MTEFLRRSHASVPDRERENPISLYEYLVLASHVAPGWEVSQNVFISGDSGTFRSFAWPLK